MSIFSSLLNKPVQAIESKIAHAKQEAKEELSVVLAKLIVLITVAFFILLAVTLASIGLSSYINFRINHPYFGYLWVGGGYIFLAVLLYILNKTGAIKETVKVYSSKIVFGNSGSE